MLVSNSSIQTVKKVSFLLFSAKKWMKQKNIQDFGPINCFISKNSMSVFIAKSKKAQLIRYKLSKILPVITFLLLFIASQNVIFLSLKRIKFSKPNF